MLAERRKSRRHTVNRVAKLIEDYDAVPRECRITDISESGARLFIEGVQVPEHFHLLIASERITRRECRVIWRLGGEIGVKFITGDAKPEQTQLMERFREEVRRTFQSSGETNEN